MDGINKKFEDTKYYLTLLSLYLKNSYGIEEQIKIMTDIFTSLDNFYEEYTKNLSLILEEKIELGDESKDFLDKLGSIFNCSRVMSIPYTDKELVTLGLKGCKKIELSDEDYLVYIKASIIKYNFNGTMEELNQLYNTTNKYTKLSFTYLFTSTSSDSLTCNIYFNNYQDFEKPDKEGKVSRNMRNLFLNHLLTIESMGIVYNLICQDASDIGVFGVSVYCGMKEDGSIIPGSDPQRKYEGSTIDYTKHLLIERYIDGNGNISNNEFYLKQWIWDDTNKKYIKTYYDGTYSYKFYELYKENGIYKKKEDTTTFTLSKNDTTKIFSILSSPVAITEPQHYLLEITNSVTNSDKKTVGCFIVYEKIEEGYVGTVYYIAGDTKLGRWAQ